MIFFQLNQKKISSESILKHCATLQTVDFIYVLYTQLLKNFERHSKIVEHHKKKNHKVSLKQSIKRMGTLLH